LKSIDDATWIRREILLAFEQAEMSRDPAEQQKLLTFAVIGGGPTGVEMSGAIAELGRHALRKDFRRIRPEKTRVVLLEGGERVLEAFHPDTSLAACRSLERMGVEVKLNSRVTDLKEGLVTYQTARKVGDHTTYEASSLEAGTVIWAAGVKATPVGDWLSLPPELLDRIGRVKVTPTCTLPDDDRIYVIGDVMTLNDAEGKPLPGVCQTAMQQGTYAARRIEDFVAELAPNTPFVYKDKGNMATIGRKSAVAEIGRARFAGLIAWFMWLGIHIIYLIGFNTKLRVLIEWAWAYIVWRKGARLITGDDHREVPSLPK
jgi:NADH dehydrogenase